MGGECYEGKEDHVWMDIEPFENIKLETVCDLVEIFIGI